MGLFEYINLVYENNFHVLMISLVVFWFLLAVKMVVIAKITLKRKFWSYVGKFIAVFLIVIVLIFIAKYFFDINEFSQKEYVLLSEEGYPFLDFSLVNLMYYSSCLLYFILDILFIIFLTKKKRGKVNSKLLTISLLIDLILFVLCFMSLRHIVYN